MKNAWKSRWEEEREKEDRERGEKKGLFWWKVSEGKL